MSILKSQMNKNSICLRYGRKSSHGHTCMPYAVFATLTITFQRMSNIKYGVNLNRNRVHELSRSRLLWECTFQTSDRRTCKDT